MPHGGRGSPNNPGGCHPKRPPRLTHWIEFRWLRLVSKRSETKSCGLGLGFIRRDFATRCAIQNLVAGVRYVETGRLRRWAVRQISLGNPTREQRSRVSAHYYAILS